MMGWLCLDRLIIWCRKNILGGSFWTILRKMLCIRDGSGTKMGRFRGFPMQLHLCSTLLGRNMLILGLISEGIEVRTEWNTVERSTCWLDGRSLGLWFLWWKMEVAESTCRGNLMMRQFKFTRDLSIFTMNWGLCSKRLGRRL